MIAPHGGKLIDRTFSEREKEKAKKKKIGKAQV